MAEFPEQITGMQRAGVDFFFGTTGKTFEGLEKFVRLNLDTTKAALSGWYQRAQDGLTKESGKEGGTIESALALPSTDEVLTYERQVAEIASTLQTQLAEAFEAQYQQTNLQVQRFVEGLGKNSPVGSEAVIAFLNQVMILGSTAQDTAYKAAKQGVDLARSGMRVTAGAPEAVEAVDEEAQKPTGQ